MKSQKGNVLGTPVVSLSNRLKGFTLIELLVVIAIIGILAATVLTSLGGARAKARAVRAKSELSSMRAQMELYQLDSSNGYQGGCAAASNLMDSIRTVDTAAVCNDAQNEWAASATFGSGTATSVVCVDWTGQIKEGGVALGSNVTTCQ